MTTYLLGIDVGTTGSKALLIDGDGVVRASATTEYPMYTPQPLWAEQDPADWWAATVASIRRVLDEGGVQAEGVAGVGPTGQMHGLVLLDGQGEVLRPCIMWNDQRTAAQCAAITEGELALREIPAIVAAVQQGAEQGMGRVRLRSRVRQVTALAGPSDPSPIERRLAVEKVQGDRMVLTWQSYRLDEVAYGYEEAAGWAQAWNEPVRALSLRYLSPVKIKVRGEWVEVPEFDAIMRAVVRRLRMLSQVHGAGEWPQAEFGPLLDLAETVCLEHHETFWTGYGRRSRRGGRHEIEGFIGQAWYAGDDLRPLLPALWLGQWLHIGKGYVMGNGRYTIELAGDGRS